MRTKQTAVPRKHSAAPTTNGTNGTPAKSPPALAAPTPDALKSPSQPRELSDKDKEKLRNFLNKTDKPFTVATMPLTRKRKRGSASTPILTQTDIFHPRLSVQYEIKPANNWECLRRYKKFTGEQYC
jgi:hypothetical protein